MAAADTSLFDAEAREMLSPYCTKVPEGVILTNEDYSRLIRESAQRTSSHQSPSDVLSPDDMQSMAEADGYCIEE